MKKTFAFLMIFVMLFALAACSKDKGSADDTNISINTESNITSTEESADSADEAEQTEDSTEGTQTTESSESSEATNAAQNAKPVHTHSYAPATCTAPAKCACGATQGAALGHDYAAATCTAPRTCKICSATDGAALGHDYAAATCTAPRTCKICSATDGAALGHDYAAATCTAPRTCKTCSATDGAALGHNYISGKCTVCKDDGPSHCPRFYFTGDMSAMADKTDVRNISFEYISKQQTLKGAAKIKVQGSSSLAYNKKNYTINFYKNANYSKTLGVDVGWGPQSTYCLKANWIDKTHARNVVTAKLAGEIQQKYGLLNNAPNNGAIDGFPVEVYINGSFHGLYTMNIPKDDWMFGMDEDNPNHIVICGENWSDPVLFRDIPTNFNDWSVEVGPETDETLQKMQRLFAFVCNSSDDEFKANFEQYLNLDATLNYYIMLDYCWLFDNVGKNMLLVTYDGNVWYPSLYDLDTSWGVDYMGKALYDYADNLMSASHNVLWARLEKLYKNELAARYFQLRSSVLDTDYVMAKFNDFYNSIPKEVLDRETEKWNTADAPIPGYPISQIQEYLNSVIPRLDAKYENWKQ